MTETQRKDVGAAIPAWGAITSGALILSHLAGALTDTPLLWGVDAWRYFPRWTMWVLAVAGSVLWVPPIGRALWEAGGAPARLLQAATRRVPGWARYCLVGAVTGAVFWTFRSATQLLGDGNIRMRDLERGTRFTGRAPLDEIIHHALYQYTHPAWGWDSRTVYGVVSVACGVGYVWCVWWIAGRLTASLPERVFVALVLVSGASFLLFFGYVETYSILHLCVLLLFLSGVRLLQGGAAAWRTAGLLGLAVAVHPLAALYLPAVGYALWQRRPARTTHWPAWGAGLVVAATLAPAATILQYEIFGPGLRPFAQTSQGPTHWLPLSGAVDRFYTAYPVLSLLHAADVLNALVLLAPALVAALPAIRSLRLTTLPTVDRRLSRFLWIATGAALGFLGAFNMEKGYARDWDLAAVAAVPLTLVAAAALRNVVRLQPWCALPVIATLMTVAVPWILVNASETRSLRRFEILAATPHWPHRARGDAFDELRDRYTSREEYATALPYAQAALQASPENTRYVNNVGACLLQLEQFPAGVALLEPAVRRHPANAGMQALLGAHYLGIGQRDSAVARFTKAINLDPAAVPPNELVIQVLHDAGHYVEAAALQRRLVAEQPDNRDARELLVQIYLDDDRLVEAGEALAELLKRYPDFEPYQQVAREIVARLLPPGGTLAPAP